MKRPWLTYGLAFLGALVLLFLIISFLSTLTFFFFEKKPFSGDKIVVLEVKGVILDSDPYLSSIREIKDREDIKGIVVRIDSPGGEVSACQEIFEELKGLKREKPLIVSMGGVAASGGLYIALAGERIFLNPGTVTGSIGVIIELPNLEKLMEKIGISTEVIKSGEFKDTGVAFRRLTPKEREYLQKLVNDLHEQFVRAVAEERKLPIEKVKAIADGRVYTGEEALKLGLADEIGNFYKSFEYALKRTGLKRANIVYYPEKKGFLKRLMESKLSLKPRELIDSFTIKALYLFSY